MSSVDTVLAHAAARRDESRARWFEFLRIPSVSAQPGHACNLVSLRNSVHPSASQNKRDYLILQSSRIPVDH